MDNHLSFKYKLGMHKGEKTLHFREQTQRLKFLQAGLDYVNSEFLQLTLANCFGKEDVVIKSAGRAQKRMFLKPGEVQKLIVPKEDLKDFQISYEVKGIKLKNYKARVTHRTRIHQRRTHKNAQKTPRLPGTRHPPLPRHPQPLLHPKPTHPTQLHPQRKLPKNPKIRNRKHGKHQSPRPEMLRFQLPTLKQNPPRILQILPRSSLSANEILHFGGSALLDKFVFR